MSPLIPHPPLPAAPGALPAVAYQRISFDKAGDEHGVTNQFADQKRMAAARGYTITLIESDNDISGRCRRRGLG